MQFTKFKKTVMALHQIIKMLYLSFNLIILNKCKKLNIGNKYIFNIQLLPKLISIMIEYKKTIKKPIKVINCHIALFKVLLIQK